MKRGNLMGNVDVVIGCITNYGWESVKLWANSLSRCGFKGRKIVILFNGREELYDKLIENGFEVKVFNHYPNHNIYHYPRELVIVVDRFKYMRKFLFDDINSIRYVVATDVKDVIFQRNPIEYLEDNLGDKKILVGSESIKYKDEDWGRNNFIKSFGEEEYNRIKDNIIYNAGTIAGKADVMFDFFLNIYSLSKIANQQQVDGGGGPDQAAVNFLLNMYPYKNVTKFAKSKDAWAAQLGTIANRKYINLLVDNQVTIFNDEICTQDKTPFTLVHQYDRYPQLNKIIEEKYG